MLRDETEFQLIYRNCNHEYFLLFCFIIIIFAFLNLCSTHLCIYVYK